MAQPAGWLRLAALGAGLTLSLPAVTLPELKADAKLTPKKFASFFGDFRFEYHPEIQNPNSFLKSRRGDCDDYAILADAVFKPKGFTTRLVQVKLAGQVDHAVCYITESRAYLDYNNRSVFFTLARSGETLREIATQVAESLEANWTSAFEFSYTYEKGKKEMIATVVKTAPPSSDPAPGQKAAPAVKVGF